MTDARTHVYKHVATGDTQGVYAGSPLDEALRRDPDWKLDQRHAARQKAGDVATTRYADLDDADAAVARRRAEGARSAPS